MLNNPLSTTNKQLSLSFVETTVECDSDADCYSNMTCNEFGNCSCPNGTIQNGTDCVSNGMLSLYIRLNIVYI